MGTKNKNGQEMEMTIMRSFVDDSKKKSPLLCQVNGNQTMTKYIIIVYGIWYTKSFEFGPSDCLGQ